MRHMNVMVQATPLLTGILMLPPISAYAFQVDDDEIICNAEDCEQALAADLMLNIHNSYYDTDSYHLGNDGRLVFFSSAKPISCIIYNLFILEKELHDANYESRRHVSYNYAMTGLT